MKATLAINTMALEQAPFSPAAPTFAVFGDSLAEGTSAQIALTGITRTGSVATATASAAHGLCPGDSINIKGATQTGYNGLKTVATTPTNTTFTYAVDESTATPATTSTSFACRVDRRMQGVGYFPQLSGMFKGGLRLVGNFGLGGDTSAQALARISDVLASPAEFVLISIGANDLFWNAGADVNVTLDNVQTICTRLKLAGKVPVILTVTADAGHASITKAIRQNVQKYNALLRKWVSGQKGIYLAEAHGATVNPTDANGVAASNTIGSDLVHFVCNGAYNVALAIYNAINKIVPEVNQAPTSVIDTVGQFASNPLMTGTGGASSGVTATVVPANCMAYKLAGSGTWVSNVAARTTGTDGDSFGQNHVVSSASSAVGDYILFGHANLLSAVQAAGVSKVFAEAHFRVTGLARISDFKIGLLAKVGSDEYWTTALEWSSGYHAGQVDRGIWVRTPDCILPAGCTELSFLVSAYTGSAGAITMNLGRLGVWAT